MSMPNLAAPDAAGVPPAGAPQVRAVGDFRPFVWLARGCRDLAAAPFASLLHGAVISAVGLAVLVVALHFWELLPGALSGFLLVAPILAVGLYELSRRRELGEKPRLAQVALAWRRAARPLLLLGGVLFAAATAWVAFSALLFSAFLQAPPAGLHEFLRYALVGQGALLFWLWVVAGGLGAALVFALTAVSAPLLLDRRIGLRAALAASLRAVGANPIAMALWAALIMSATLLSMAALMLGFLLVVPVIGHATWHAYRELLDAGGLPAR